MSEQIFAKHLNELLEISLCLSNIVSINLMNCFIAHVFFTRTHPLSKYKYAKFIFMSGCRQSSKDFVDLNHSFCLSVCTDNSSFFFSLFSALLNAKNNHFSNVTCSVLVHDACISCCVCVLFFVLHCIALH